LKLGNLYIHARICTQKVKRYSERASKDVSAYFCCSIFVFCLMNNKDRTTKTLKRIYIGDIRALMVKMDLINYRINRYIKIR